MLPCQDRCVDMSTLRGRLLVAAPPLVDPNFDRTVVLVLEHGEVELDFVFEILFGRFLRNSAAIRFTRASMAIPWRAGISA